MAYSAECDAHSRDWHKTSAKSHRDLALLTRGADDAKADMAKESAGERKKP